MSNKMPTLTPSIKPAVPRPKAPPNTPILPSLQIIARYF